MSLPSASPRRGLVPAPLAAAAGPWPSAAQTRNPPPTAFSSGYRGAGDQQCTRGTPVETPDALPASKTNAMPKPKQKSATDATPKPPSAGPPPTQAVPSHVPSHFEPQRTPAAALPLRGRRRRCPPPFEPQSSGCRCAPRRNRRRRLQAPNTMGSQQTAQGGGYARCEAASSSQNGYGGLAKVMGIAHHLEPKWLRTENSRTLPRPKGFLYQSPYRIA